MKKYIPHNSDFPLSQAIIYNDKYTMEISWIIWIDPNSNILEDWIKKQTERIMETIKETLEQIWWDMNNIVKSRIFLSNMWDYSDMNEVYGKYFSWKYPTRFAIEVSSLPLWALVEIECMAAWESINEV